MAHVPASIQTLEERAFNAWPALETVLVDGWVLRFAAGFTKRANSVNALRPKVGVAAMIGVAGPLYAAHGLPLVFRLSPLAGASADATLEAQGFRPLDETIVMVAPLADDLVVDQAVTIATAPEGGWCAGFAAANRVPAQHRATHDRMLAAIRFPAAFAGLSAGGEPLGFGLAVIERGMVGLFDITTRPEARRQGVARRLVASLMAHGRQLGAAHAYLQVVATNAPAIALYRWLGFAECYRYHYRIAP